MKRFKTLLEKEDPEKARIRKIALAMGLKYKGFGQWTDPVTGKVTHSEMDGDLVPVDKEKEDEAPSGGFGSKEGMGASFNTFQNKQAPTGTGTNIRDIGPDGVAQAPTQTTEDGNPVLMVTTLSTTRHSPSHLTMTSNLMLMLVVTTTWVGLLVRMVTTTPPMILVAS